MNTFVIVILALSYSAVSLSEVEYRGAFENYKTQFGKTYLPSEHEHRYTVFKSNLDFVNNFDSESRGFRVGINKFADLSSQEFARIYNGMNITKKVEKRALPASSTKVFDNVAIDWRTKGAVTDVKDQGQCGSCWSFSTTGSIEGAYFLAKGQLTSLSEQNLIDCSTGSQGNQGCQGGFMDVAFQYVISNNGIDTEDSYPYTASGPNSCQYSSSNIGATISSFTDVTTGDESALAAATMNQPISVAIDASQSSFQMYSDGVYNEPQCSTTQLDHGVLVVGYGTDDSGTDYWIVKNSWGASWGMSGYLLMSRNKQNNCGIATSASYPTV